MNPPDLEPEEVRHNADVLTRRSFIMGGLVAGAMYGGWRWMRSRQRHGGLPYPLRAGLEWNHALASAYFDPARLAPTIEGPPGMMPRRNGTLGLETPIDLDAWRLRVENTALPGGTVELSLRDLQALPRTEFMTNLYCIEGWSDGGHWAGVRVSDFLRAFPPRTRSGRPADPFKAPHDLPRYVALETPDRKYYVGIDMASAMQPQTILCYEMGGKPLTLPHGAPLRLYTPVKYGIKSLKRIGRIGYTDERPRDYWAERGYDWFAGL